MKSACSSNALAVCSAIAALISTENFAADCVAFSLASSALTVKVGGAAVGVGSEFDSICNPVAFFVSGIRDIVIADC